MSVRTDTINLNVNINGNKAQNDLNNFRKKAADVKLEMEGLNKRTKEYADKKKELAGINEEMAKLKQQIGITALSQKELVAELNKLKAMKGSVVPFSNEFKELDKQIKAVENRLYDVRNGVQGFTSFFSKIKDEVKQFGVMAAGYLGFQFITSSFTNIISGAAKMSDQLADIRKAAGLTEAEVKKLSSALGKLDTRTSTSELREIAKVGGQLGIAKEDLLGFTAAVDKLNVALGDEFSGGAEEITNVVGKLRNTFSDIRSDKVDDDLLRIGNALNSLGAAGIATAPVVSDFAQRIGAAGQVYGLTAGQTFGLSAALQEMGVTAERGSTAVVKLLQKLASSPDLFFEVVKSVDPSIKSLEDFKNIINTDISKAFTLVAQGFAQSKGNATDFAEKLADAEVGSAAISEVLSKVGQNSAMVADKINLATGALKDQSSIQEEFNIKNETFGATLDKLGKELAGLAAFFSGFAKSVVYALVEVIAIFKQLPQLISNNITGFSLLAAGILLLNKNLIISGALLIRDTALKVANNVATRAMAVGQAIVTAGTAAYNIILQVVTGQLGLAAAAARIWAAAMTIGLGPIGIALTLVGALVVALSNLGSKTREVTQAEQLHAEVSDRAAKSVAEEETKVKLLTKTAGDNTKSLQERKAALNQLIAINPQYLNGLTLENIRTAEGTKILNDYVNALRQKAQAQAVQSLYEEKLKQRTEDLNKVRQARPELATASDADVYKFLDQVIAKVEKDQGKKLKDIVATGNNVTYREAGVDLGKMLQDTGALNILDKQIQEITKKTLTTQKNITQAADNSVAGLRTRLQMQIKDLEGAYERLNATDEKGKQRNLAQRKQLEAELSNLDGKQTAEQKKAESKEASKYNQLKKDADKFYDDLQKLKEKAAIAGEAPEQKELDTVKLKYQELIKKAKEFYIQKAVDKKQYDDAEKLLQEAQQAELDAIFQKYYKKRLDEGNQKEYEEALLASQEYFDQRRVQAAQDFAANSLTQKEYDQELKKLDQQQAADRLTIATDYSSSVKKAAEDVKNFRKDQEKQTTADLIEETKKRKETADQERLSAAQRGVITAKGKGIDAEVEAKKALLKIQFELESQYLDQKSELYKLKEAELQQSLVETDKEAFARKVDNIMQYVGYFQSAMSSLNQFLANREARLLQQEKKANEDKKKDLKKQLDGKLISQAVHDKKVQELNEASQKRESEIKRKQAVREKALNIFNAFVNNASAIVKTMSSVPFPFNIPLAIAQGIAGGLQIAAIKNAPLPELGVGDWIRKGPKHKDPEKGIPVMIERDEAVMSAAAMTDPEVVSVTGTTAQITSALNSRKGGTNWAGGASVQMPKWRTEKPSQINPGLVRYMATGGLGSGQTTPKEEQAGGEEAGLLRQLINEQQLTREEIKTMKTKLRAVVSIKEYREEEAKYDAAKTASSIA